MRVLIACEFSGIIREEFRKLGHDAWSCDLLATEIPGQHLKCDVRSLDLTNYDLLIAHPPCTDLAVSGARWFKCKKESQIESLKFVKFFFDAPVNKICIENPVSIISTKIKKPTQCIQPWQFGEFENKKTCLWLKNLPNLIPTAITPKIYRDYSIHKAAPNVDRWKLRSRTFQGIAEAMAQQWGSPKTTN